MTTIAYHHESGIIACDGRSTQGSSISDDSAKKWVMIGDDVWFFTGSFADRDVFIKYHSGDFSGKPEHEIECSALIISGAKCYEAGITPQGQAWRVLVDYNHASGSGRDYAVAAMDHGKGAADAVRYASKRDIYTGGKISAMDINTLEFTG